MLSGLCICLTTCNKVRDGGLRMEQRVWQWDIRHLHGQTCVGGLFEITCHVYEICDVLIE
jgi:hypothetical protein